jgi:hypothetical protein
MSVSHHEPPPPLLVPLAEAQRLLGVKITKLNELAKARQIEKVRIGKRALVTMASIRQFVASLKG